MDETNKIDHIAVVMDGNRRWAKSQNIALLDSYKLGLETLKKLILSSINLDVKHLTCYAFSTENWKRNSIEIETLKQLLSYYLSSQQDFFILNNIKLNVIGKYESFGKDVANSIENLVHKTASFDGIQLNLALNYGAKTEISDAIKSIVLDVNEKKLQLEEINENLINNYLYTKNIPEPNFLIRTGGNKRLSNFLLWQLCYSELFFIDQMWPEFNENILLDIISKYKKLKINKGR
jgi:undecaprenyl diphosphate synthase